MWCMSPARCRITGVTQKSDAHDAHARLSCAEARAIAQLMWCHAWMQVDPVEDTDVINFELALADIGQIEKRQERLRKGRAKTKEEKAEQQVGANVYPARSS